MNEDYREINACPISNSPNFIKYLDFGPMPLVNNLNDTREESLNCQRFPLAINYCPESKLSLLSVVVKPEILFSHYLYKSGTSKPYADHCESMYEYLQQFVKIHPYDVFIDIGGNDGTLLATFKNKSKVFIDTINVDPSVNLGEISAERGITTLTNMWSSEVAKAITTDAKAKVITSTNVFQHTEPIRDFIVGINSALADDGVWCLEFPYWGTDLETNQYDQTYHEHIYYYLLTPLIKFFHSEGLEVIDVSKHPIHGGTLRVISRKHNNEVTKMPKSVYKVWCEEEKYNEDFYRRFGKNVSNHITESRNVLLRLKSEGKRIAAFGAAAKGCTWLNASNIDYNLVNYVIDDTDVKQGKFMPGTGIQIFDRKQLINNPPDYLVILAHNFTDHICNSVRPIYKGKFIRMFPTPLVFE